MIFRDGEGVIKRELPFEEAFQTRRWPDVYMEKELKLEKRRGEKTGNQCTVLDIPCNILEKLLPRSGELPYMAHVRQVGVEQKEERLFSTEGRFSSLIGNRALLPVEGQNDVHYEAHVLSLEGMEHFLAEDEAGRKELAGDKKAARMIRLAGWQFSMKYDSDLSFPQRARQLDAGYLGEPECETTEKLENPAVKELVSYGYRPMNYKLRNGRSTPAWYQPPLLPAQSVFKEVGIEHKLAAYHCLNHGDGGIAYLEAVHMLDVTYAAAWTLGRLLGMRNQSYLTALYDLRRLHYDKEKQDWNINVIEDLFMDGDEGGGAAPERLQAACSHQIAELMKKENK